MFSNNNSALDISSSALSAIQHSHSTSRTYVFCYCFQTFISINRQSSTHDGCPLVERRNALRSDGYGYLLLCSRMSIFWRGL